MSKSHVTINISNSTSGGGLQNSIWFVRKTIEDKVSSRYNFSYILNDVHAKYLPLMELDSANVLVVDSSPMRSRKARTEIGSFLRRKKPALVFSVFGPSGIAWRPQVSGVANAFITSASLKLLAKIYGPKGLIKALIFRAFGFLLRRSSRLIFETETERESFCRRFNYPINNCSVIFNSVDEQFFRYKPSLPSTALSKSDKIVFLCVTTSSQHKNVCMLPLYAEELSRNGFENFVFVVTMTEPEFSSACRKYEKVKKYFDCVGHVAPKDLIALYERSHMVVHPSELETYSAVYNEVRFCARPLLVSDRPFARDVCGRFGYFFEPSRPEEFVSSAARIIAELPAASRKAWNARELVITPQEKYARMLSVIDRELLGPKGNGATDSGATDSGA